MRRQILATAVPIGVVAVLGTLYVMHLGPANPVSFLLLAVVGAAVVGGVIPGMVACAIVVTYAAMAFWLPGHPWRYDSENIVRLWVLTLLAPLAALLVGSLHYAAERGERRRQALEAAFLLVANNIEDFVVRRKVSGEILEVNESFAAFLGVHPHELVGVPVQQLGRFGVEGSIETAVRRVRGMLERGVPASTRLTMVDRRGRRRQMEFVYHRLPATEGEPEVLAVGRDVTDFIAREVSLRRENVRLRDLSEAAQALFLSVDARALVQHLRDGVTALTGAEARLLAPLPAGGFVCTLDLLAYEDGTPGDDFVRRASAQIRPLIGAGRRRIALPIVTPTGRAAYVIDVSLPDGRLRGEDVALLRLFAQYFALAAHNALLYQEVVAQRASIIELDALKGDLIAMLAHDFRGQLSIIAGNAELIGDDPESSEETRKSMRAMVAAAMRLGRLAEQTLAFARAEKNELRMHTEPTDLAALVAEVVAQYRVQREIVLSVESAMEPVAVDAERMHQVFENLIANGIKYSPDGQPVAVAVRQEGLHAIVEVRDQGIGIPAGELPLLFARFARAANARGRGMHGTGFGLYLAKRFVELHGGTIEVSSVEGEGSVFRVRIPLSHAAVEARAPRTVLVADGDGDSREFLGHVLRAHGLTVREAASAGEAAALLRRDRIDVALVDERLPQLDHEPARRDLLTLTGGGVRLISLADSGRSGLPRSSAVVSKPFLLGDLLAAVDGAASS